MKSLGTKHVLKDCPEKINAFFFNSVFPHFFYNLHIPTHCNTTNVSGYGAQ